MTTVLQTVDIDVSSGSAQTLSPGDYFYQLPGIRLTTTDAFAPALLASGTGSADISGTVFATNVGIDGPLNSVVIASGGSVVGGTTGLRSLNTTAQNNYTIDGELRGGTFGLDSSGSSQMYLHVGSTGSVTAQTSNAINLTYPSISASVDGNVSGVIGIRAADANGGLALNVTQGARVTATSSYAISFAGTGNFAINGQVAGHHGIGGTSDQSVAIAVGTTGSIAGSAGVGIDIMSKSAVIAVDGSVTGYGDGIFNGQASGTSRIMVGAAGFVSGSAGIQASNNTTVGVAGTVNGNMFWGITVGQFIEGGEIHVYAGGVVTGGGVFGGGGVRVRGSHLITNDGTISSAEGPAVYGENGAGYLLNTGLIEGSTVGILFSDTWDSNDVHTTVNTGTISGSPDPQIATGPNFFAYDAAGNMGTDRLINQGTMIGDVRFGQHAGSNLVNSGILTGNVFLGSNGQVANSTLGTVSGLMVGGSGNDTIVGGKSGNTIVGGAGDDMLYANPTMDAANNHARTMLDGGTGINALYGGGGYNTFVGGTTNGGYNQIWGGASGMTGVLGYTNNTISFAGLAPSQSVYVDLLSGHNAYINSGPNNSGVYTYEDSIINVPNVIGSASGDIIIADNGVDWIQGGNGADQLIAGTGPSSQDTFVYAAFTESNLNLGYDTVAGFKIGTDKIDISGLFTNPAHVQLSNAGLANSVYVLMGATFNPATDLAISINATTAGGLSINDFVF
jgi:serralysin